MSEERLFQPGGGVILHEEGDGGYEAMHERSSLLLHGQSSQSSQSSESPLPAEALDWILISFYLLRTASTVKHAPRLAFHCR